MFKFKYKSIVDKTDKATRFLLEGESKPIWLPDSQFHFSRQEENCIFIAVWLCEKIGLQTKLGEDFCQKLGKKFKIYRPQKRAAWIPFWKENWIMALKVHVFPEQIFDKPKVFPPNKPKPVKSTPQKKESYKPVKEKGVR